MSDEFEGMGGSYTVDPKTGKKTLVQRTDEKPIVEEPAVPYTEPNTKKSKPVEAI
jgi:hypothetical protein